jgi:peptidoglycan/xylan/chitin deacetylase (PgdA/CDA1 family)
VNALMYHDLVAEGDEEASGFPGRDAALYKISVTAFSQHLDAISQSLSSRPARPAHPAHPAPPVPPAAPILTFDDGGVSAMVAADLLEQRGWIGHFFITTNYIGRRGFLSPDEVRSLAARGHVIGAHSCSHPLRMARCPWEQLVDEWSRSCSVLSGIIGGRVDEASVPGGDFAPQVAQAAARAGIVRLFTSEPTGRIRKAYGLTLAGRFTVQRWTSASTAAAMAQGDWFPCARQTLIWNAKKMTKRLGGARYLQVRRLLLGQRKEVQWGDFKG